MNTTKNIIRIFASSFFLLVTACSKLSEPVPEFYGVYALDNGKLHFLQNIRDDQEGPLLSPDARFIVYQPSTLGITHNPNNVLLRHAGKIRHDVELLQRTESSQIIRIHEPLDSIGIFSGTNPLMMKAGTKDGSLEFVSAEPLPPGLYMFDVEGDFYPIRVLRTDGEELPLYDRYYVTIPGGNIIDSIEAMSRRGMYERKQIGNNAIQREYFDSTHALILLQLGQKRRALDAFSQQDFMNAYIYGNESIQQFPDDPQLDVIVRKAPILAMDLREERQEWENLNRWVNHWVSLTGNRPDVVERGTQLKEFAAFDEMQKNAVRGDLRSLRSHANRLRAEGLTDEQAKRLTEITSLCLRQIHLGRMNRAKQDGNTEETLQHFRSSYLAQPSTQTTRFNLANLHDQLKSENPFAPLFMELVFRSRLNDLLVRMQTSFCHKSEIIRIVDRRTSDYIMLQLSLKGELTSFRHPEGFMPQSVNVQTGIGYTSTRVSQAFRYAHEPNTDHTIIKIAYPNKEQIREVRIDHLVEASLNNSGEWFILKNLEYPTPGSAQHFHVMRSDGSSLQRIELPFKHPEQPDRFGDNYLVRAIFFDREGKYVALSGAQGTAMYETDGWKLLWSAPQKLFLNPVGISMNGMGLQYAQTRLFSNIWSQYVHGADPKEFNKELNDYPIRSFSSHTNVGVYANRDQINFMRLDTFEFMGKVHINDYLPDFDRRDRLRTLDISPDGRFLFLTTHGRTLALLKKTDPHFSLYWDGMVEERRQMLYFAGTWRNDNRDTFLHIYADGYAEVWQNGRLYEAHCGRDADQFVITLGQMSPQEYPLKPTDAITLMIGRESVELNKL